MVLNSGCTIAESLFASLTVIFCCKFDHKQGNKIPDGNGAEQALEW